MLGEARLQVEALGVTVFIKQDACAYKTLEPPKILPETISFPDIAGIAYTVASSIFSTATALSQPWLRPTRFGVLACSP